MVWSNLKKRHMWGRGGVLVDRAADSGPYDPSSIPLGGKRKINKKEPRVDPYLKKS